MKTGVEIQNWLRERIAREIKVEPSMITIDAPFTDFGLDSIIIVTLVDDLEYWLQMPLDPTIFWEYPSIEILTEWLVAEKLSE